MDGNDSAIAANPDTVRTVEAQRLASLLKLSGLISRPMLGAVAAPRGMSLNELRVLMCLGGEGALAGHMISELMSIQPMNVSRAIASLLERGWIEKVQDAADRRHRPVRLSQSGLTELHALSVDLDAVAGIVFSGLSARDMNTLGKILGKVVTNIEKWPPG